jgi:hypothetical protein
MKLIDRFGDWLAVRLGPKLPALQRLARKMTDVVQAVREDDRELAELASDLSMRKQESETRLRSLRELRFAESLCRMRDSECVELAESFLGEADRGKGLEGVVFKERLWELELALEDRGWVRETTLAALEFSRYGVQQLIRICRVYAIKNPIIKRIAEICELYTFGRGFEIRSDDDTANDVIQDFLKQNDSELGHNGLAEKEYSIQTDGALYFGLPTDSKGNVKVNMVDPLEIMDVITEPDDTSKPLYFLRQWNRLIFDPDTGRQSPQSMLSWYPSLENWKANQFQTGKRPMNFQRDIPVNWDMPLLRIKVGCPAKWRWGVPPVYGAVDWARAYKDALEDYATVRRTLARFALMVETKGGPGAIAAYQALFQTTFADSNGTQIEKNPPPVVGSAHISGPSTQIQAFKSSGAQSSPEETRRLLLLACAAGGMPETFFGDASTGSLATAVSLDRPTELKFTGIQRRWKHTIKMILNYVLDVQKNTPGSKMREARQNNPAPQPIKIEVTFPTVVEHEIQPMIQAITEVATMGGRNGIAAGIVDRRTIAGLLLAEIGYDNRDDLLDKIYGKSYKPAADVTDQRSQPAPQSVTVPLGKALTDLSNPPPLPPPPAPAPVPGATVPGTPPAPAPPKPGAKPPAKGKAAPVPTKKERLAELLGTLKEVANAIRDE